MDEDPFDATMKRRVRETLLACGEAGLSDAALGAALAQFREAVLNYGLHTTENVAAIGAFDFGRSMADGDSSETRGLRFKESGRLLTDVLWRVEELTHSESSRSNLPGISPVECAAALRLATLLLTTFESK